ncbi:MAG: 3-hydroxyacyl-ACP dehydratase FabZ [Pseudomonadota bacterium]
MNEIREECAVKTLDVNAIMKLLPHRYPFLLIDKVTDYKVGEYLHGVKNVTINEPCFTGHFPQRPVFPGVLIIESLAQATGILSFLSLDSGREEEFLYYLASVDNTRFKQPVVPGDQLVLQVELEKLKRRAAKYKAQALVNDKLVCCADLMCVAKGMDE